MTDGWRGDVTGNRWFGRTRVAAVLTAGLLLAGMCLAGPWSGATASAAPGDPPGALSLRDLGGSSSVIVPGQQGEVSLSLPVPPGLTPTEIRGIAQFPSFVTGGEIDILQEGRLISRTPVGRAVNAPITLPLMGVRVERNAAAIVLRTYLRAEGWCLFDDRSAFRLVDPTVNYAGRESVPDTVAEFLPPILRKLTIYVPRDVKPAEAAAAVAFAGAVVADYGTAPVAIETAALPRTSAAPPTPVGPLERQVVINTDLPAGLSLGQGPGWPVLRIGGNEEELKAQVDFLSSDLSSIAITSAAVAGPQFDAPQLAPSVTDLASIGVTDRMVRSAHWPSISIGIDQTRLGRPSKDLRVQLIGTYTPMGGQIAVSVGERVIASWPAEETGSFDRWVDVPADLLGRYTELTVTYNHGDVREQCGAGTMSELTLSAAGEVRSQPADPPEPGGFASLPQALMPRSAVAWTKGDVPDVSRAVALVSGLQRLSAAPLGFDVVPVDKALSGRIPAVIVAADGDGLGDLSLPVVGNGQALDVLTGEGRRAQVVLSPGVRFGSLQVARDSGRTVLVATSTGAPADLDALLAWLKADPERWPALGGEALIQAAGRDPVEVLPDGAQSGVESSDGASVGLIAVVGVGVLAVAGIGAALILRRRRGRREG